MENLPRVREIVGDRVPHVDAHAVAAASAQETAYLVDRERGAGHCLEAELDIAGRHLVDLAVGPCATLDDVALCLARGVKTRPVGPDGVGVGV